MVVMKKVKGARPALLNYLCTKQCRYQLHETALLVLRGKCCLKILHNTNKYPVFHYTVLESNSEV